jgi:hypothetical protein
MRLGFFSHIEEQSMANMSYCRFENTYHDMKDCEQALIDDPLDPLSESEERYRRRFIRLCIEVAKSYGPTPVSNALHAIPLSELEVH